jgi:hypothetical protein
MRGLDWTGSRCPVVGIFYLCAKLVGPIKAGRFRNGIRFLDGGLQRWSARYPITDSGAPFVGTAALEMGSFILQGE